MGYGRTNTYSFVVTSMLAGNLSDLRRMTPNARFSASTSLRLGRQALAGIRDVHKAGFVHRDVKVYCIDFIKFFFGFSARQLCHGQLEEGLPRAVHSRLWPRSRILGAWRDTEESSSTSDQCGVQVRSYGSL